jgi:hypothetical protein
MKKESIQNFIAGAVLVLLAMGIARAAAFRYQQKEDAIRAACRAEMEKLGPDAKASVKAKYPTPEIQMITEGCFAPGASAEVTVKGKFVPGTKFVFENDNVDVVKENLAGGLYQATLKIASGIGPQSAAIAVISPVSGIMTRRDPGIRIGGRYEWALQSQNGWKVVAAPQQAEACGDHYLIQFFKGGEPQPFQKRTGSLHYSLHDGTYRFSFSGGDSAAVDAQAELAALQKKMMDPKLPGAERDKLMARMNQMVESMTKDMAKMADPGYIKQLEAEKQKFGCEWIELKGQSGALQGNMRCSDQVGTRLGITGSYKLIGQ